MAACTKVRAFGAAHALDCKVNAEAGASKENDFEHEKPRKYREFVGVCGIVVGIVGVVLVHVPSKNEAMTR